MRSRSLILVAAVLFVAACGASTPGASGEGRPPTPSAAGPTQTASLATPSPATSPSSTVTWVDAGTTAIGRRVPHAVLLGDGTVLVVGNDENGCVRDDSAQAETWDPSTNAWTAAPSLNKPRAEFAAVALRDGRALVTGGVNAGTTEDGYQDGHQAFSSTYTFDRQADPAAWVKSGQLGTARFAPAAAVLPDGRVLVAGGVYLDARTSLADPVCGATLAAYRPEPSLPTSRRLPVDDVEPPALVPVLATAELYDPATGSWSPTGSLRHARLGAAAVTLADGRVLMVGSREGSGWNYSRPIVPERAFVTAEIYDPATGEFSPAGTLPALDWSPVADLNPVLADGVWTVDPAGSLVALPDGGALWIDRPTEWYGGTDAMQIEGRILRTLRFDAATGAWTEIDRRVYQHKAAGVVPDPMHEVVAGHTRDQALVAPLADGRILIAGGIDGVTVDPSTAADIYDPVANTWTALPPMPVARANGAAVALPDGSVILVGGDGEACALESCECGEATTGTATAVRFVP